MPNYTVDTSFLNQPAPKAQSLADLVNTASGIQNYQQAQQINPLALQEAQNKVETSNLALQKQRELQQPEIEAGIAKAGGEVYELRKKYANELNDAMTGMLQSKSMREGDVNGFISHVADQRDRLIDQGMPKHIAEKEFAKLINAAQDPKEGLPYVRQTLENTQRAQLGATNRQNLMTPSVQQINGVSYFVNPTTMQITPVGGQQQVQPQGQPQVQPQAQPQGQMQGQPQGQMPVLVQEDPQMSIPPGVQIPQLNEQQKASYTKGQALKDLSAGAAKQSQESLQTIRKVEQYADKAAGSAPGQALRSAGKWIKGDADYDELLKNIARMQLDNAMTMGTSTDASRHTTEVASGSADITEKALRDIINRAKADATGAIKFEQGLKNYVGKRGDYNGNINATKFRDAWINNYDPRLLMYQNINESNLPQKQKDEMIREINAGLTKDDVVTLRKKQANLMRLENGDYK